MRARWTENRGGDSRRCEVHTVNSDQRNASLKDLIRRARQAQQSRDLRDALSFLDQAGALVHSAPEPSTELSDAECAIAADKSVVLQMLRDSRGADRELQRAEDAARRLLEADASDGRRLALATILANRAALHARERMQRIGHACATEVLALIDGSADGRANLLRVSALQAIGTLHFEAGERANAKLRLREAIDLGSELATESAPGMLPQVVDASARLVQLLRADGAAEDALPLAERTLRLATAAYEAGAPAARDLVLSAQVQLAGALVDSGRFADAEDEIWKAIEIAPGPATWIAGADLYCALLRRDEPALEAGNLPRHEVAESLGEIVSQVPDEGSNAELRRLLRARYAVMVDRRADLGKQALTAKVSISGELLQLFTRVMAALQSDLQWLQATEAGDEGAESSAVDGGREPK